MWDEWWVWAAAALLCGILELAAQAYVFLGFAVGAAAMAAILLVGGPAAALLAGSTPVALLAFAVISGAAWIGLRAALGPRHGSVQRFDRDVNDD